MSDLLRRYKLPILTAVAYLLALVLDGEIFRSAVANTWMYVREMLEILPAVFILSALVTVWVPPRVIMDNFGGSSGLRGKLMSVLVGSVSAGPIYAAFPVTQSLLRKGASLGNVVVIISAWAVVKLPMLIVEARFLGVHFAAIRYLFTVPAIMGIGALVAASMDRDEVLGPQADPRGTEARTEEIAAALPGVNCGACGHAGCTAFARALIAGEEAVKTCTVVDGETGKRLHVLLRDTGRETTGPGRGADDGD